MSDILLRNKRSLTRTQNIQWRNSALILYHVLLSIALNGCSFKENTVVSNGRSSYSPPRKLQEGNIFSSVCLSVYLLKAGSVWPLHMMLLTSSYSDMLKLNKLGPHCTGTPQTCPYLFNLDLSPIPQPLSLPRGWQAGGLHHTGILSSLNILS